MDRLEKYCLEHGWEITTGYNVYQDGHKEKILMVKKPGFYSHCPFQVVSNIDFLINTMKQFDYEAGGRQLCFF